MINFFLRRMPGNLIFNLAIQRNSSRKFITIFFLSWNEKSNAKTPGRILNKSSVSGGAIKGNVCVALNTRIVHSIFYSFGGEELRKETFARSRALISSKFISFFFLARDGFDRLFLARCSLRTKFKWLVSAEFIFSFSFFFLRLLLFHCPICVSFFARTCSQSPASHRE